MARRLRVMTGVKVDTFTGPDTESVIAAYLEHGDGTHDPDAIALMLSLHEEFRLGNQLFLLDWTHPELGYCTVPPGYEWK